MAVTLFVVLTPKIMGFISMICSSFLMFDILRSKTRRSKVPNRLLVSLSATDFLYTFFVAFLTTWPVPQDVVDNNGNGVDILWSAGNRASCRMQGFLDQFFAKSCYVYNAELATTYFIMIKFGWTEERMRKIEWVFHVVALSIGLVCAIVPISYNAFNPTEGGFSCWISETPINCRGDQCDGGANFMQLQYALSDAILLSAMAVVIIMMAMIYISVRQVEKRVDKYRYNRSGAARKKQSRKVGWKALFYAFAFTITWFFNIYRIIEGWFGNEARPIKSVPYYADILLFPTFGIWTFLSHFRQRFIKNRKEHPEWSCWELVCNTVVQPSRQLERETIAYSSDSDQSSEEENEEEKEEEVH